MVEKRENFQETRQRDTWGFSSFFHQVPYTLLSPSLLTIPPLGLGPRSLVRGVPASSASVGWQWPCRGCCSRQLQRRELQDKLEIHIEEEEDRNALVQRANTNKYSYLMFETVDPSAAAASSSNDNTTTAGMGNDGANRNPSAEPPSPAAAVFRREGRGASHQKNLQQFQPPGSPYNNTRDGGLQQEEQQQQQSAAAGSLNAFLNGAYACGTMTGVKFREGGGGGGSARGSSVGGVGAGGGGSVFVVGGGLDAPPVRQLDVPLRQLIETKERELHEIHDFRIRCAALCDALSSYARAR